MPIRLAPAAIISRPPDSGKTEDDLREYWRALAAVAKRPVILQTTGGVAYKGPVPSVRLLIELAREFPHFGYVKEEAAPIGARIRDLAAARRCFERSLAIFEQSLPPEHPAIAAAREWLAGDGGSSDG